MVILSCGICRSEEESSEWRPVAESTTFCPLCHEDVDDLMVANCNHPVCRCCFGKWVEHREQMNQQTTQSEETHITSFITSPTTYEPFCPVFFNYTRDDGITVDAYWAIMDSSVIDPDTPMTPETVMVEWGGDEEDDTILTGRRTPWTPTSYHPTVRMVHYSPTPVWVMEDD